MLLNKKFLSCSHLCKKENPCKKNVEKKAKKEEKKIIEECGNVMKIKRIEGVISNKCHCINVVVINNCNY